MRSFDRQCRRSSTAVVDCAAEGRVELRDSRCALDASSSTVIRSAHPSRRHSQSADRWIKAAAALRTTLRSLHPALAFAARARSPRSGAPAACSIRLSVCSSCAPALRRRSALSSCAVWRTAMRMTVLHNGTEQHSTAEATVSKERAVAQQAGQHSDAAGSAMDTHCAHDRIGGMKGREGSDVRSGANLCSNRSLPHTEKRFISPNGVPL